MTTASDIALRRPDSAWQMFRVFTLLALQGFGGVLAVSQRELVERQRWLSRDDFLAILSLGQILPGPNIVNMGLVIGQRFFGWRGALASVGGLLALPLCIDMALQTRGGLLVGSSRRHPAAGRPAAHRAGRLRTAHRRRGQRPRAGP